MPFVSEFDHTLRRIYTVATGRLTFANLKAHLEAAASTGVTDYPELIDARGATLADRVALDDVRRAARFLKELAASGPVGRAAVVTDVESVFGVIRQLGILAGDACKIEPFREPVEARLWLGWDR